MTSLADQLFQRGPLHQHQIDTLCKNSAGVMIISTSMGLRRDCLGVMIQEKHFGVQEGEFKTFYRKLFNKQAVKNLQKLGEKITIVDMVGKRIFTNSESVFEMVEDGDFGSFQFYQVTKAHNWEDTIGLIVDKISIVHERFLMDEDFLYCTLL